MAKSQQSINPTMWVAACCISATYNSAGQVHLLKGREVSFW